MLALRLAWRDARGAGLRGLRIVLACLALGVAAIATVGGLRQAIEGGIALHGREVLGGDLDIAAGSDPLPPELGLWLVAHGAAVSSVVQFRAILIAANGERQLVELKAVDGAWPLVGRAATDPPQPLASALDGGIVVEPLIRDRLGLRIGDTVRLGAAQLVVRATLTDEPDRAATPSILGPRALIAMATVPATGLIQPGSLSEHMLRASWPSEMNIAAITAALEKKFPNNGWHIRGVHDAVPGAEKFIDQLALFMSLVGLSSLLVGGIGVATGVRAWLEGRARSIAILRCLGASGQLVFSVSLLQVLALSIIGIAIGLAVGAVLPIAALSLFADALPVPPRIGLYPDALGLAALYGILTAATFALYPLGRAMRIPGAALFRDAMLPERARPPGAVLAATFGLAAGLVALTIFASASPRFAAGFCLAAVVALALFRLGGSAVIGFARALPARSATIRLGLGNLHRPGSATALMLVAVGLGLSTLASVALIQGNLAVQIDHQLPRQAPSFYFVDIQSAQLEKFESLVSSIPGATGLTQVPNLVARVVAVNATPVEQLHPTPDTAWAMRGDRGLTYAATPPAGTKLVEGQWWPADYAGPPLVSFDANLARGWGVHIGDTITVTVLGRPIVLRIANLRQIDWRSLGMNYAMVASPGLLVRAPHSHIATVRVPRAEDGPLLRVVTDALPNVTGIDVADVLAAVGRLLGQIGAALAATGSLTLAAGALVLAGAVASGQRRRIQQAVILKSLGATRGQIRSAWLVEFGMLGAAAGVISAAIGTAASYAVMHYVMQAEWSPLPGRLAVTLLGCIALMLAFGYLGTAGALRAKAAPLLRND